MFALVTWTNCRARKAARRSGSALIDHRLHLDLVRRSLAQPYRPPVSMVLLCALVPFYILIPAWLPPAVRHAPAVSLDRALPLIPWWALVYGILYLFLILLPIFVVRMTSSFAARSMRTC